MANPMTDIATSGPSLLVLGLVLVLAATLSAALIVVVSPWLKAYALARPNVRSSHREPTPQGGGAAVIAATFAVAWGGALLLAPFSTGEIGQLMAVTAGAALVAVVGAVDDVRGVAPLPRLILQAAAVGIVIAALPADLQVLPMLPRWIERAGLLVGGVWFVNLTNFMDGIDWMTVAEVVPITAALALLGLLGFIPALPMLLALALLGAILGFAPFNKPVAKLFLGDVGSLPIGLVLAWLLLALAARGHLAAALLLPLYYVADATLTLFRRLKAREPVWQAHRTHFYQRAVDGGFTVPEIATRVFATNCGLAGIALLTIPAPGIVASLAALATGAVLVGMLLANLARGKR